MVRTNNGFDIAETDLKLRGPGDLMGTQQSGVLDLLIADLGRDGQILERARTQAIAVLEGDPELLLDLLLRFDGFLGLVLGSGVGLREANREERTARDEHANVRERRVHLAIYAARPDVSATGRPRSRIWWTR